MVFIIVIKTIASFIEDAPFVSIPGGIMEKILETLHLQNEDVLYDLGCGDARVLLEAAKKNPNIKAVGVEIGLWPYLLAKIKTRNYKNIKILRQNIFDTDLSSTNKIFVYLYPQVLDRLLPKFKKECKTGTRLVSCDFEFKDIEPTNIFEIESNNPNRGKKLLVYTF